MDMTIPTTTTTEISQPQQPQASNYPAYPNQYGLGAPIGSDQQNKNQQIIADSSRGFSPWSLGNGESGAR